MRIADDERPAVVARVIPRTPLALGAAGLLPQIAALAAVVLGDTPWRIAGALLAMAYGALILSFLGGLWWGLAAASRQAPRWVYVAVVAPSLVALAIVGAVALFGGMTAPAVLAPPLVLLGIALIASLAVDRRLHALRLAPPWWLILRTPLSLALGALTIAVGLLGSYA